MKRFMLQPKLDALSRRDEEASADPEETGVPIKTLRQISLLKVMQHENIVRYIFTTLSVFHLVIYKQLCDRL